MTRRMLALAALVALVLAASGCFNPFSPRIAPTAGIYVPPPSPTTPAGVIRLLEWCWKNRDVSKYREVFTDDFQFIFALRDSAGNPSRDPPLTREGELNMAHNLFIGGTAQPPATGIMLMLDPTLNPQPDIRPGRNPKWHKEILTSVDLSIKVEGGKEYRIAGYARFFVVRGDSALIPRELNFAPDSNRWFVDQWNDETLGDAGAYAMRPAAGLEGARPAVTMSLGGLTRALAGPAPASRVARPASALWMDITWDDLREMYLPYY